MMQCGEQRQFGEELIPCGEDSFQIPFPCEALDPASKQVVLAQMCLIIHLGPRFPEVAPQVCISPAVMHPVCPNGHHMGGNAEDISLVTHYDMLSHRWMSSVPFSDTIQGLIHHLQSHRPTLVGKREAVASRPSPPPPPAPAMAQPPRPAPHLSPPCPLPAPDYSSLGNSNKMVPPSLTQELAQLDMSQLLALSESCEPYCKEDVLKVLEGEDMSPFLTFLSSLEAFHDIATAVDTKKSRLKRLAEENLQLERELADKVKAEPVALDSLAALESQYQTLMEEHRAHRKKYCKEQIVKECEQRAEEETLKSRKSASSFATLTSASEAELKEFLNVYIPSRAALHRFNLLKKKLDMT